MRQDWWVRRKQTQHSLTQPRKHPRSPTPFSDRSADTSRPQLPTVMHSSAIPIECLRPLPETVAQGSHVTGQAIGRSRAPSPCWQAGRCQHRCRGDLAVGAAAEAGGVNSKCWPSGKPGHCYRPQWPLNRHRTGGRQW